MDSRPKKILIVAHHYPPHISGVGIVARNHAVRLAAAGNTVNVITSDTGAAEKSGIADGVNLVRIRAIDALEKWGVPFPVFSPALWRKLAEYVKISDVVHIHDVLYISSIAAAICARIYKKPIVLTQHIALVNHPSKIVMAAQRFVYATAGAAIFNASKKILTFNDRVDDFLIKKGVCADKLEKSVNGVDGNIFYPAKEGEKKALAAQLGLDADKKIILFVGRFAPKKGSDKLLECAADDYQIVFAGDEAKGRSNGNNFVFLGKLGQNELARVYRAADLFVLPSEGEGFPLSVQEAMASGLPVVVGDDEGYRRYKFDRNLICLLNKPTADSVRRAIVELIADKKKMGEMASYSLAYAENNFSWPAAVSKIEKIYRDLTANRPVKKAVVTTSWDDGHILDMRLAALLKKYNVKGTFYVAPEDVERKETERLAKEQVREISLDFEIGGHTISHRRLPKMSDAEARREIRESKAYLEKITGQKVVSFCYPGGEYRAKHIKMVRAAGYSYARTVKRHSFGGSGSLLEARTTVNTYNHIQDLPKIAVFARFNPVKIIKYFQWDQLAKAMFDRVLEDGGEFHLWGHSWEVDGHNDWGKLESVLAHISGKKNVSYLTNGGLAQKIKKNILIAPPYFPPQAGGVPFYALNTARRLRDDFGWNAVIAASGKRGFSGIEKEEYGGLKIYRLSYWFKISNTPVNPLWALMLARVIKEERISIVNAHAPVPVFGDFAALAARKIPFVLTYHTGSLRKGVFLFDAIIWMYEKFALKLLLRRADSIVCASDYVRFNFLNEYLFKSATVAPAADCENFKPAAAKKPGHTLLFVAGLNRAEKYKGLATLIDAVGLLGETIPDLRLVVAGEGDMRKEYQSYAEEAGLRDRITFKGKLIGGALADAYRQADIFVLPTCHDNAPMVIIEAMASGLPVVSTMIGEIPQIVDEGKTGFLIRPGNPEMLAAKIAELFENPGMMADFGAAGRLKCASRYNWKDRAAQYDEILERLSGASGKTNPHIPRLTVVAPYFYPKIGGLENYAYELARRLHGSGRYRVTVVTSNCETGDHRQEAIAGMTVYRLPIWRKFSNTPINPLWFWWFKHFFKTTDPDIIHIHAPVPFMGDLAAWAAPKGTPVAVTYHSGSMKKNLWPLDMAVGAYEKIFLGLLFRRSDAIVAVSRAFLSRRFPEYAKKTRFIPTGVDLERFSYSPLPDGGKIITYVGRIERNSSWKGIDQLFKAMVLVVRHCPDAKIELIGTGDAVEYYRRQAEDLGIGKSIIMNGVKTGPELAAAYRRARAVVLPSISDSEAFSLVLVEAMASGRPVIATDIGGNPQVVDDGVNGLLVPAKNPAAMAKAIEKILTEDEFARQLGRAGAQKSKSFSWEKRVGEYEDLFSELTKKNENCPDAY